MPLIIQPDLKIIFTYFSSSETKAAMNLFRKDAICSKKEKDKEIQYEDPPDGGWGWMVVVHGFLVCLPHLYDMVAYPV